MVRDQLVFKDSAGQEYSIKTLNYFISNIKLSNSAQNIFYSEVGSYHLINAFLNPNNTEIILRNVPRKKFSELELSIGLDSIANSGIDKTGDLDPGTGMYWNWADGYKFFEFEGSYKSGTERKPFLFHVGENVNYRTIKFSFSKLLSRNYDIVKDGQILLDADAGASFESPNKIDLTVVNNVMSTATGAKQIADNYAFGFLKLVGAN